MTRIHGTVSGNIAFQCHCRNVCTGFNLVVKLNIAFLGICGDLAARFYNAASVSIAVLNTTFLRYVCCNIPFGVRVTAIEDNAFHNICCHTTVIRVHITKEADATEIALAVAQAFTRSLPGSYIPLLRGNGSASQDGTLFRCQADACACSYISFCGVYKVIQSYIPFAARLHSDILVRSDVAILHHNVPTVTGCMNIAAISAHIAIQRDVACSCSCAYIACIRSYNSIQRNLSAQGLYFNIASGC